MRCFVFGAVLISLLVVGGLSPTTEAATFTVTKETDDNGPCDIDDCALREAIIASNENPGPDTILIPGGRYILSIPGWGDSQSMTGSLHPRGDIDIIGAEQSAVIIDAAGIDRVFLIVGITANISNVTITGGYYPGFGAGLRIVDSIVAITNSTIIGNHTPAYDGGGISVWKADVALINSVITGNTASRVGGGIDRTAGTGEANVTLINSTVSNNYAGQAGAIISAGRGDLTLLNSTVA
ncbi:MAG: hypothetical protein GY835_03380, partial [bacterium]|nr:hypothetical protein [bacterium]